MNVCQSRADFGFNFVEQCLNNTGNSWLHVSDIYEKYAEMYFKSNGFLLSVGFIVALLLDTEVVRQKYQTASKVIFSNELKISILAKLLSLFCLVVSLIISPLILIIFSTCYAYQTAVHFMLKYEFGQSYIGLLEGTDVVWAIEDISKSVINILAIINIENIDEFKQKLTDKLTKIIEDKKFSKMKYYRLKSYGYYFWTENPFNVSKNINYLKTNKKSKKNWIDKEELLQLISEYNNKLLPRNHTTSWEILIGRQRFKTSRQTENNYPVLFRFHHSIGDGIALIRMLLEAADAKINEPEKQTKYNDKKDETMMSIIKLKLLAFFQTLLAIIFVPGHLIQMNLMKTIDNSILHGKELTGEKTLAWISEKKYPILQTVKYIKSKFPGVSFLDVVLASLSEALYVYFKLKTSKIPPSVTAVILERVDKIRLAEYTPTDNICQLHNRFSVGMVNLPILPASSPECEVLLGSSGVDTNDTRTGSDFVVARLQEVNRMTSILKNASPDYQINYWLLKVVSKLLPEPILRPMLHSAHSTMVVSNILGPDAVTICDGHLIKNLIFWLPHRGLTGIGISLISYAGKIEMGITADKALISNSKDAKLILQIFVTSLKMFNDKLKKRERTAHF